MKLKIAALVFFASLSTAYAETVPYPPPSAWNSKSFGLSATSEYFMTKANYDEARGSYQRLTGSNTAQWFDTKARIRYSPVKVVSGFAGVAFAHAASSDASTDKTNANLTEAFFGVNFQFNRRWWRVIPEIEVSLPLDPTETSQTIPLTSDGVTYGRVGVHLFKPFKYVRFESYLGMHFPAEGLAKRFMYSLGTEVALFDGFSIGGGVQGYESVLTDTGNNASRLALTTITNAGSRRYWTYNPALIEGKLWLGLRADKSFAFRLGYNKTINGARTAEGQSILLSIVFNSPGSRGMMGSRVPVDKTETRRASEGFTTEPEVTDPELFDAESLDETEKLLEQDN